MPRVAYWLAVAVLCLLSLVPLAVVELPGLGDYFNHLARMHVLVTLDQSEELRALYGFSPDPPPYLAMQFVVPALAEIMPLHAAGRVFVAMAMLGPVLGALVLHRAASGGWSVVSLLAFLMAYNLVLSWGFLNYLFGLGFALLLLAGWLRTAHWPRWWRALAFAAGATGLFYCHLLALVGYCLAVAGVEIGHALRLLRSEGPGAWRRVALDWLAAASQALPALVMIAQMDFARMTVAPALTAYGDAGARLSALFSPFRFIGSNGDVLVAVVLVGGLAVAAILRRVRFSPTLWPAAATLLVGALAAPEWVDGTWGMHLRLPLLAALVGVASLRIDLGPREQVALLAAVALLAGYRSAAATLSLREVERPIAELRALAPAIPRGARVLVAQSQPHEARHRRGPERMTAQMAMVVLIERDVFIPFLFSGVAHLRPRPELLPLSTPHGHPITRQNLLDGLNQKDGPGLPEGDGEGRRIYWRDWPAKFSYVIWQHFGAPELDIAPHLVLVASGRGSSIYRVLRHKPESQPDDR